MKIYKYPVTKIYTQLRLPYNSQILSAGEQDGDLFLWAMVTDTELTEMKTIHVVMTGEEFFDSTGFNFVNTVQLKSSNSGLTFVYHIFEETE